MQIRPFAHIKHRLIQISVGEMECGSNTPVELVRLQPPHEMVRLWRRSTFYLYFSTFPLPSLSPNPNSPFSLSHNNLYNGGLRRARSLPHRSHIQAELWFQQYPQSLCAAVFGFFSLPETEAVGVSDGIAEPQMRRWSEFVG